MTVIAELAGEVQVRAVVGLETDVAGDIVRVAAAILIGAVTRLQVAALIALSSG